MTMSRKYLSITTWVVAAALLMALLVPVTGSAASDANCGKSGGFLGFPTWYKYLDPTFVDGECKLTFEFPENIGLVAAAVIEILLRVAALIAVGFVLYGGLQYIMSQGEPERLAAARSTIINALIGLVITVTATGIVSFVAGRF